MSKPPQILIGVPSREEARWSRFYEHLHSLQTPDFPMVPIRYARGKSPAAGRNLIIREALKMGVPKIYFCDDDHFPTPEVIMALHKHDLDAVAALYPMAHDPFWPCVFDAQQADGAVFPMFLTEKHTGVKQVAAVGGGCLLIKTDVFRNPGWKDLRGCLRRDGKNINWWTLGQIESDEWCDDTYFCHCLNQLGYKIYCDFDLSVEHATWFGIRQVKNPEGQWLLQLSQRGKRLLAFGIEDVQRQHLVEQAAERAKNGEPLGLAGSAQPVAFDELPSTSDVSAVGDFLAVRRPLATEGK